MEKILTEAPIASAIAAWKRSHDGQMPDTNSPEFKAFKKQVDQQQNRKYQQQISGDQNIESFYNTLVKISQQKPEKFPQEFYNALTNLTNKKKVELCNMLLQAGISGELSTWVQVIGNLYNSNKIESAEITLDAMKESAKYPWISGLLNRRLIKEDDFNLDNFDASVASAGGMNVSSDNSTETTTNTDQNQTTDFNLDDISNDPNDLHIPPAGGAVDSIGMGGGIDNNPGAPMADPNAPEYRIIDVIFDPKDPEAFPRVKEEDVKTGETRIRDIFEIDV